MSRDKKDSKQSKQLLRAMSDIDDRFLLEAVSADMTAPEARASGARRMRRYSTWALTAAACLVVLIVGRYVSVSTVKNETVRPEAMSEEAQAQEEEAQVSAEDSPAQEGEEAQISAEDSPVQEEEAQASVENSPAQEEEARVSAENSPAQEEAAGGKNMTPKDSAEAKDADVQGMPSQAGAASSDSAAVSMVNPFSAFKTLEEAENKAGFSISLPEAEKPYDTLIYRVMDDAMIEVIYTDKEGREGYRIRKGKNLEEDISGDYNVYPRQSEIEAGQVKVSVYGDKENEWKLAVWTIEADDGGHDVFSFAVSAGARTFSSEEIEEICQTLV